MFCLKVFVKKSLSLASIKKKITDNNTFNLKFVDN